MSVCSGRSSEGLVDVVILWTWQIDGGVFVYVCGDTFRCLKNDLRYTVDCSTLRLLLAFSKAVLFGESESFGGGVGCRG